MPTGVIRVRKMMHVKMKGWPGIRTQLLALLVLSGYDDVYWADGSDRAWDIHTANNLPDLLMQKKVEFDMLYKQ